MTKENIEELAKIMIMCANWELDKYIKELDTFFSKNVCIPKGVNRHPYADVLHEWVEGGNLQIDKIDCPNVNDDFCYKGVYRIKPSEPVYEWQWLYKAMSYDDWNLSKYMVDSESSYLTHRYKLKLEETKRIRQ